MLRFVRNISAVVLPRQIEEAGMKISRLIVGLILIAVAVGIFVFGGGGYSTAGAVGLAVLGLVSIAIARKK